MPMKVPTMETGTARIGNERDAQAVQEENTTSTTSTSASKKVCTTSPIEARVKFVVSIAMS